MISLNEIRRRATEFAHEWAEEEREEAEAKTFWDEFFQVFGVSRRRVAAFEYKVNKEGGAQGYIDMLWKGVMLAEHKSKGKDLDRAYTQATDYFPGLKDAELPQFVVVSDFAKIRLYDLDTDESFEFPTKDLSKHIERFGFISGYNVKKYEEEEVASIKAAELMADLHHSIADTGYSGHALEVFLTRILFCLFSEDTGIFEQRQFQHYVEQRTNEDGSDLGAKIMELFYILNSPLDQRQTTLDEQLGAFPYVNGQIFAEQLAPIMLDSSARTTLIKCCTFDWSQISAAIFGSLFQGVMDKDERHQLGAHYTSEINIMKVIEPLFLDELYTEFDKAKRSPQKLDEFHNKLASLKFLDPACGCGNFLVTTYKELRHLELQVLLKKRKHDTATLTALGAEDFSRLHVNQFYGIEIEEFPALVARTAMYLADHQATLELQKEFGNAIPRIPLEEPATIVHANALTKDWKEVIAPEELNYILGNPPFLGAMLMSKEQRADLLSVFEKPIKNAGVLDFVSAWYIKSADYIQDTKIKVGLVSTNSITQGEQVGILWQHLSDTYGVVRHFAHRTFKWKNDAKGNAAVFCVIIGFANYEPDKKYLYTYQTVASEPEEVEVENINAYLVNATEVFVGNRKKPICDIPEMLFGSMPRDGGNLIFTETEKDDFLTKEPRAEKWIRPYTGAQEFINRYSRYCLWLIDIQPNELRDLPEVLKRVEATRQFRLASKAASTRKFADTPTLFCQIAQPDTDYLLIPRVSSERRFYIPIGKIRSEIIANDQVLIIPNVSLYHFGILTSKMHMSWMRTTCGRLKSDYRYSKDIVYNNFPWPGCGEASEASRPATTINDDDDETKTKIETAAQAVLDARAEFPNSSLADLYDPRTMPPTLTKAHTNLDKAVDQAYNFKPNQSETKRIAFLFDLYQKITKTDK